MTNQRNIVGIALMTTAIVFASVPFIAATMNSAEAAGFSQKRHGKQANANKRRRHTTVRRKRNKAGARRRIVRKNSRRFQQRRRTIHRSRPAVTMPKRVITAKPRPIKRPAVTMPKTIVGKPRPYARPVVTKPRPYARPAVTTPKTVITGRPRPAVTTPKTVLGANAGVDPTAGRIRDRQAQNTAEYHKCAGFSLRVFQAGLSQAGNDSAKIRAARSHYQGNLGRCRAL